MDQMKLSAFAGHSFDDNDKQIVEKILKFLTSAGVDCESGEPAENRSVSAKIRERIDRNSIFVGIFTSRNKFEGKENYSTSNWVIQESGYAIGKGKQLVLLVEGGVDNFPELQGDIEYVPFQRISLETTFIKLNEIVRSIRNALAQNTPSETTQEPPKSDMSQVSPAEKRMDASVQVETTVGKTSPAQQKNEILRKLMAALFEDKDFEKGKRIVREEATKVLDSDEKIFWEAYCLRESHGLGDPKAFRELEELVSENLDNPEVRFQYGITLSDMRSWEKAIAEFLESGRLESDPVKKSWSYKRAALSMYMGGKTIEAKEFIEGKLTECTDGEPAYNLLLALTDLSDKEDDKENFVLYAEKALELRPSNSDLRFQTAYKYGEIGRKYLSLYHYRIHASHKPDGACLNNLGVVLSELGLSCKSITSYKNAADLKSTLAMANLAYKYIETGFMDEALSVIKTAFKLADEVDVHGNVGQAKNTIEEIQGRENKQEEVIIRNAEIERTFRLRFVEALCTRPDKSLDLNGKWQWGDWKGLVIKQSDSEV